MEITTTTSGLVERYLNDLPALHKVGIKFREYTLQDARWVDFSKTLDQCSIITGMKEPLTDGEYLVIKSFIMAEIKDISNEEMIIAFHKYATGKINLQFEHYGKLSARLIGHILSKFKELRNKAIADHEKQSYNPENTSKEATREDKLKIRQQYLNECFLKPYEALKSNGQILFDCYDASDFFLTLYKKGVIKLSPGELQSYRKKAIEFIKDNYAKQTSDFTRLKQMIKRLDLVVKEGQKDADIENNIKRKSAQLCFVDYCKKLIKENVNIEQFLTKNGFYEIEN